MTEKKRITHVINALTIGGAQSYLKKIVTSRLLEKYTFEVIAFKHGPHHEELVKSGVRVKVYESAWPCTDLSIPFFSGMAREIRKSDLLHLHLGKAQFYANLVQGIFVHRPSVVSIHGLEKIRYQQFDRLLYPLNQRYLFVSEYLKNHRNFAYIPDSRKKVIYPTSSLKPSEASAPSMVPASDGAERKTRLLWCGRYADVKGIDHLVELAARLDAEGDGFEINIVGTGPETPLTKKLKSYRVVNLHPDSMKEILYSESDIIMNTSYFESIGISNIDALKAGKYIIGFDVGGVREVIDESCGVLVRPYDLDEYVLGLKKIRQRIADRTGDSLKIALKYRNLFAEEKFLDDVDLEYETVLRNSASPKKKVLFFVSSNSFGGGEKNSIDIADNLDQKEWESTFIIRKGGVLPDCITGHEVNQWDIGDNFDVLTALRLRLFCRLSGTDLVHTHLNRAAILSSVAGAPVVSSVHGINRAVYYRHSDRLIAVSESARKHLVEQGVRADRITVINNFTRVPLETRTEFKPVLVSVGRFHLKKRFDISVNVLLELSRRGHSDFMLYLIGQGDELEKLQDLVNAAGLKDKVIFTGYTAEVFTYLQKSSFFILPSEAEAFPISLLEAMSAGCIPLVNDLEGIREILPAALQQAIVRENDPVLYADCIQSLWKDPDRMKSFSQAVQDHIRSNFTAQRIIPRIESLYRELTRHTP